MTDPRDPTGFISASPIDPTDEERRRRVEQLQRRRAARPNGASTSGPPPPRSPHVPDAAPVPRNGRRRRGHPAGGARIGAAGVGLATMLGLVAVMGLARGSATAGTPGTVPASPSQVVVVVHHVSSPTFPGVGKSPTPGTGTPSPPIALTARPTVQAAVSSSGSPVVRTNGSR